MNNNNLRLLERTIAHEWQNTPEDQYNIALLIRRACNTSEKIRHDIEIALLRSPQPKKDTERFSTPKKFSAYLTRIFTLAILGRITEARELCDHIPGPFHNRLDTLLERFNEVRIENKEFHLELSFSEVIEKTAAHLSMPPSLIREHVLKELGEYEIGEFGTWELKISNSTSLFLLSNNLPNDLNISISKQVTRELDIEKAKKDGIDIASQKDLSQYMKTVETLKIKNDLSNRPYLENRSSDNGQVPRRRTEEFDDWADRSSDNNR